MAELHLFDKMQEMLRVENKRQEFLELKKVNSEAYKSYRIPTQSLGENKLLHKVYAKKQPPGSVAFQSRSSRTLPKNPFVNYEGQYPNGDYSPYKSIFQQKREKLLSEQCKMLNYNNRIDTIRQNLEFEHKLNQDKEVCKETQMEIQRALNTEHELNRHVSTNLGMYAGHQILLD